MAEEVKPVNLPAAMPDTRVSFIPKETQVQAQPKENFHQVFESLVNQAAPKTGTALPVISTSGIDTSGRYPKYYTGLDNESLYAENQGFFDKAFNGVAKMSGIAGATFINGTVGLVNGLYEMGKTGKFNSFYNNDLSNSLNDYTESLNDKYAFYKTERERNGNWWEPTNLFSANMLFDNIVGNMGFMVGAGAAGILTGGLLSSALKGIGAAAGLISTGAEGAATADAIIGEATALSTAESLGAASSRLQSAWNTTKGAIGKGLSSDKAIKSMAATAGEAGLEALNNSREFRQKMINDYASKYGVAPTGKDLEDINKYSESVGNASYILNSAVLGVSNYVMLPKMFSSSFKSEKTLLSGIGKEVAADYVSTIPTKGIGKLAYGAYKGAGTLFARSEALEEGAQYAIQTGTQNYFGRKVRNQDAGVVTDMLGFGIKDALTSDEGLLNMFIGGVSGGLTTMGLVSKGADGKIGLFKGGTVGQRGFFGFGGEEAKVREQALPALNVTQIRKKLMTANSNIAAGTEIQEERKEKIAQGDVFEAKNLETDYAHAFIDTRIKYGAEELIYNEINELREQATRDFVALQKEGVAAPLDTKEAFLNRLTAIESQAKLTETLNKELTTKYGTIIGDDGKRKYDDQTIDMLTYAMVKVDDFTKRMGQMSSELAKNNVFTDKMIDAIVSGDETALKESYKEIDVAIEELKKTKPVSDIQEMIGLAWDVNKAARSRKAYLEEYNKIFETPEEFKTEEAPKAEETELNEKGEPVVKKKPSLKVKTADGDEDLEIGTEYFTGGTAGLTESGKAIIDFPRFTVLGENEDGTLKIRNDETGFVKNYDKSVLNNFKVGKVADAKNNKKASFYMANVNTVYEMNFGKDPKTGESRKKKGRLGYSPKDGVLLFHYVNDYGKPATIEVKNTQFVAQKNYKQPMLQAVGTLSKEAQAAQDAFVADKTPDPRVLEKVRTIAGTLEVIFEETMETLEDTKRNIDIKTEELAKVEEELNKLTAKVEGPQSLTDKTKRFKAATHRTIQAISQLTKLRDNLKKDLALLQAEQSELELRLDDVLNTAAALEEYPGDYREFYETMRESRTSIQDAILETGLQINKLSDLIDLVEGGLEKAYKTAKALIDKFFEKYPNVPLDRIGIIDFLNKNLEANKAEREEMQRTTSYAEAEKILPYAAVAGNLLEDIHKLDADLAQIDEIDVIPNEPIIAALRDELKELNSKLKEYETQLAAKEGTLKKLRELYKLHKQEREKMEAEELEAARNTEAFREEFLGTADTSVPTVNYESDYEADPKKDWMDVLRATTGPTKKSSAEPLREHHVRANRFGLDLESFPNRDNIRAVFISKGDGEKRKGNEADLNMTGLIDHMGGNSQTVVMVMVQENADGSVSPVGVDGKVIESQDPKELIAQGIYQTMPDRKLTWADGESMFRNTVPGTTQDFYRAKYGESMDAILDNPSLQTYEITPSFGTPDITEYPDQVDSKGNPKKNYGAKNSVKDAGLITVNDEKDDFVEQQLITVPTTSERVTKGSTSFSDALGRIFLNLPNALVKLNNSNITEAQANAIYDAVLRLSIIGKVKGNEEATELINWLRTVIYWGTPKNRQTGEAKPLTFNSLFFDSTDEGFMLFISGKGSNIPFTPKSIRDNKANIITTLQSMYHNVNSLRVNGKDYKKGYTEILSVDEKGNRTEREWQNYQTYLLSSEGRKPNEIPLTTNIRPLNGPTDINRSGVYFVAKSNLDAYSQAPKTEAPKGRVLGGTQPAATAPKAAAPVQQVPELEDFQLNGETENTLPLLNGTVQVTFIADQDNFYNEDGSYNIDSIEIPGEAVSILEDKFKTKDPEVIKQKVTAFIIKTIKPQVDAYLESIAPVAEEVVEEEPVVAAVETFVEPESTLDDPTIDTISEMDDLDPDAKPASEYRIANDLYTKEKLEREDWPKFEAWLKQNFPNVPVYRVKNMIQASNGRQAWGMFKNGAIYITENALVGTGYHEVFEAIWKALTPVEEQYAIMKEMRSRGGEFFDEVNYKTVKYSAATDQQLKEKLADEFAEFIHTGKKPAASEGKKSFIRQLFDDIVNFFKEFFTGVDASSNTMKLFSKIGNGYYAQYNPFESKLSFANDGVIDVENAYGDDSTQYRLAGFTDIQWNDLMQSMTYLTISELTAKKKSIFEVTNIGKDDLYARIKGNIGYRLSLARKQLLDEVKAGKKTPEQSASTIKGYEMLYQNIMNNWNKITEAHQEYVLPYQIDFDENDEVLLRNEDNSGKEDYLDATKINSFKKASPALKLFLASLPEVDTNGNVILSTVAGERLVPVSKVEMAIRNVASKSRTPDEMIGNIKKLGDEDATYKLLYQRLTYGIPNFNLSKMTSDHHMQLISALWRTFKKTAPDVKYIYILNNGDVVIDDSNFTQAADQALQDIEADMIVNIKDPKSPYFTFDKEQNAYVGKPGGLPAKPNTLPESIKFLSNLGIEFTEDEILNNGKYRGLFDGAVGGIYDSIKAAKKVATVNANILDIKGRLRELAQIKAVLTNPEFDSTYYNMNGELTQTFIGTNVHSDFYDNISQINNLSELENTSFSYLMTGADAFAQNSAKIKELFNRKTGRAIEDRKDSGLLKNAYADGIYNSLKNNRTESSKLNFRNRLVQQMNLAIKGYYANLVPGDSGLDHMTYMGNSVDIADTYNDQMKQIKEIFKGYFLDELAVSREDRPIVAPKGSGRLTTDLRFFKNILENFEEGLHDEIVLGKVNKDKSTLEVYEAYKGKIDEAVEKYLLKNRASYMAVLNSYGLITNKVTEQEEEDDTVGIENVAIGNDLTQTEFDSRMFGLIANFAINNIEFHKLVYGDPYRYKDMLKRAKNFNSPHQAIIYGSNNFNIAADKVYNKNYAPGDIAYTDFSRDGLNTATIEDIKAGADHKGYTDLWEEGDGGGIVTLKGIRQMRINASEWSPADEKQFLYEVAYEKADKDLPMSPEESIALANGNPQVQSTFTPKKPIAVGNLGNMTWNNPLLDKFSLYPISYRMAKELGIKSENNNLVKLYDRMQASDVDYVVFSSARKVGAEVIHKVYDNGQFVTDSFGTVETGGVYTVPFAILSTQSEVPTKESSTVTTGSQPTKLMTLDLLDAGVPLDFEEGKQFTERFEKWNALSEEDKLEQSELFREIKNNQSLIEAMIVSGMEDVMNILGIAKEGNKFVIRDLSKAANTLRAEVLKREVNKNVIKSLDGFLKGEAVIEATPAYQQIRNILYSIADKNITSRTMTGGQKVQIASSFLEANDVDRKMINGKEGYTSDTLRFYYDIDPDTGERLKVAEIAVRRWFDNATTKNMSDAKLLEYLNTTDEGKNLLRGIAFRIPTQKQNSIDVFRIAKFLPKEFGDAVVIPSALVKKVGSDFDIDKLFLYFKNVVFNSKGLPEPVKYLDYNNSSREERYYNWVMEKADRDTAKYIRFLAKGEVAKLRREFKEQLDDISKSYKDAVKQVSQLNYDDLLDTYKSIKVAALSEQDDYMKELFAKGAAMFRTLSKESKEEMLNLKLQMAIVNINGPEEIRRYLALASILSTQESTEDADKKTLKDMIRVYEQELKVLGGTDEQIQKANAEALEAFRKDKSSAIKSVGEMVGNFRLTEVLPQQQELSNAQKMEISGEIASASGLESFDKFIRRPIMLQNTKLALQNAYVDSSERLVTSDYNFDQLVKPNSAEDLKQLSIDLDKDLGIEAFDYTSTDITLRPEVMARLRYGYQAGKSVVGIAAQSQTLHSLLQRTPFLIDPERKKNLSITDRFWIGDAEVKFDSVNRINGKVSLSGVKSADGKQFISDINGMVIDGSVDITKDDWLIRLGITPNVAATYLFLANIGVPIEDVAYFMKQPIIRDYLRMLENKGYSYLFIDDYVKELSNSKYRSTSSATVEKIPAFSKLKSVIKKDIKDLTEDEKLEQQFMLREFLKYAKMAEQLFYVSQGTNFDTANLNDPFLVFKKMEQLERAKNTIFSDVDEFMKASFLGNLGKANVDFRNLASNFLLSDRGQVRNTIQQVLSNYTSLNDYDFLRIAQTTVLNLFDWAVQNDKALNTKIQDILISETGTASKITKFFKSIKEGHPLYGNYVVDILSTRPSQKVGQANNLYIKNKANKTYDQNRTIYAFEEIKAYLTSQGKADLYDDLVRLSVLQSGLKSSAVSFTSLLPYEDFLKMYGETLSYIEEFTNLDTYIDLKVLNRTNWNNTKVDPSVRAPWIKTKKGKMMYNPGLSSAKVSFVPKKVVAAVNTGKLPKILQLSTSGVYADSDVISYSWEEGTTKQKKQMRKDGDYSYIKRGLFQKVYDGETPLVSTYTNKEGVDYDSFVYKAINAWGQGALGNEFWMSGQASKFNNGYEKVEERKEIVPIKDESGRQLGDRTMERLYSGEVSDDVVVRAYDDAGANITAPAAEVTASQPTDESEVNDVLNKKNQESQNCNG